MALSIQYASDSYRDYLQQVNVLAGLEPIERAFGDTDLRFASP